MGVGVRVSCENDRACGVKGVGMCLSVYMNLDMRECDLAEVGVKGALDVES